MYDQVRINYRDGTWTLIYVPHGSDVAAAVARYCQDRGDDPQDVASFEVLDTVRMQ